jgi:exosortase
MSSALEIDRPTTPPPQALVEPPKRDAYRRPKLPVVEGRLSVLRVLLAIALLGVSIWVCREAWHEIFIDYGYGNSEYSHILMVPFVVGFLVYVRRLRLRHFRVSHTWMGPLLVATGLSMSRSGLELQYLAMFHAGAVLVGLGAVVSALGKNAIFRFLPATLVLAFLIPVPGDLRLEIAQQLQNWTAGVVQAMLSLFNFPINVSGNNLTINSQRITVAEACNGMRLVFPLFLIAFAFAFGLPLRNSIRLMILLVSPIVALACNIVRTVPIALLYGYAPGWYEDPKDGFRLASQIHDISGWIMLPIAVLVLLGLVRLLRWLMLPVQRYTLASQ